MNNEFKSKKVIMIHGLAAKPPKQDCHTLWTKCIIENIRVSDPELAGKLENEEDVFHSAYWADSTPHHIADDRRYVNKLRKQVDNVIEERKKIEDKFHVGRKEEIGDFFQNRGLDLLKLLAGALHVKDDVMKMFMRETELYAEDQYIADKMREPLEHALRQAWDSGCDVALLAHSMGTFISYDVLWRYSHRGIERYKEYRKKRIQLFVTMGSPLGEPAVRDLLFARHHKNKGKRQYPTNIDFWHNYACLGDVVSHQHNFEEVFFEKIRKLRILPNNPKHRAIDYASLHNPFEVVTHSGNKDTEKRNPHKSYGYLVQPRLGTWLIDFFKGDLKY